MRRQGQRLVLIAYGAKLTQGVQYAGRGSEVEPSAHAKYHMGGFLSLNRLMSRMS